MANPRALLLQARVSDDPMAAHERACFLERTGLDESCLASHDLVAGPASLETILSHDALFMGGSGAFYASKEDLPGFQQLLDLLCEVVDRGHPTMAVCYGYHCLARALGGTLIHDPPNTEVGTFQLELTEVGKRDPLLGQLPESFDAQMGHKDRVDVHPADLDNLVSSERCSFQAFRVRDKPVWAVQFHPELTRTTNLDRFKHYLDGYAGNMSVKEQQEACDEFRESPDASSVLRRFVELVFD